MPWWIGMLASRTTKKDFKIEKREKLKEKKSLKKNKKEPMGQPNPPHPILALFSWWIMCGKSKWVGVFETPTRPANNALNGLAE